MRAIDYAISGDYPSFGTQNINWMKKLTRTTHVHCLVPSQTPSMSTYDDRLQYIFIDKHIHGANE